MANGLASGWAAELEVGLGVWRIDWIIGCLEGVVGWGCGDGPAFDDGRPAEDCVLGLEETGENGLEWVWCCDVRVDRSADVLSFEAAIGFAIV